MPDVASVTVGIDLGPGIQKAAQQLNAFTSKKYRFGFDNQFSGPLKSITGDIQSFDTSLTKATNRVVAFGAAAAVFRGAQAAFSAFARATVEVEDSLAKINVNLNESADGLKRFSADLFNIARQTGQSFEVASKAAEEFARQGLGAEETIKRTRDALILSRIAALDSAEAVNDLTAAVNTYAKEAVTTTDVLNKLVALDTRFAVSSKDLADGLQRAGAVAADAGVSLDKFLGIITAVKQTTGRDGAVIGNALKTIFERTKSKDTLDGLEQLGVATKDLAGQLLPVDRILQNLAATYDDLSQAQQQQVSKQVANIQQINIFKALLGDLTKAYSVTKQAAEVSGNATDEALQKNIKLNQTLKTQIESTKTTVTQFFSSLGSQDISGFAKGFLSTFGELSDYLRQDSTKLGGQIGDGLLKGISNVLTGPAFIGLAFALGKTFKKILSVVSGDLKSAFGISNLADQRAATQERINNLIKQGTVAELEQLKAATTLLAQKRAILAIEERIAGLSGTSALANSFIKTTRFGGVQSELGRGSKIPNVAYVPNMNDGVTKAIQREMAAGVPKNMIYVDRDKRVAGPDNPQGLVVANRRDEPIGGFQGVNRVLSEGGNPRKAGIVGNFADGDSGSLGSYNAARQIRSLFGELKKAKPLSDEFNKIGSQIQDATGKLSKASRENVLGKLATEFNNALLRTKMITGSTQKASPETQAAYEARRAESARGSSQTVFGKQAPVLPARFDPYGPFRTEAQAVSSATRGLGVPSIFGSQRRDARRLTDAGVSVDSDAAQGFLQNRNLQRSNRRSNASLAAAIGLPIAAGFIPEGQGGTARGRALGGVSSALNGAGAGAIFGPQGAALGAALGAIYGVASKATKSLEEFSTEIDNATAAQSKIVDSAQRVRGLTSQIGEARQDNADPRVIARLQSQRTEAIQGVEDPAIRERLLKAGDNEDKANDILEEMADSLKKIEQGGAISKQGRANSQESLTSRIGGALQTPNRLLGQAGGALTFGASQGLAEIGKGLSALGRNKGLTDSRDDQRALSKAILPRLSAETVSGINLKGLNQGSGTADDIKELNKAFASLGAQVETTSDNYRENVAALNDAVVAFRKIKKAADEAASDPKFRGFSKTALSSSPNLDTFRTAALTGRNPRASRGSRAESTVDFFNELENQKVLTSSDLEGNTQFKQARAGTQFKRATEIGASFVQGANPLARGLFDQRGDANAANVKDSLTAISRGGDKQQAEKALLLLAAINKGIDTLAREDVKNNTGRVQNLDNLTGYEAGANYGAFAKTLRGPKNAVGLTDLAASNAFRNSSSNARQYLSSQSIRAAAPTRQYDLSKETKTFDQDVTGKYGGAFDGKMQEAIKAIEDAKKAAIQVAGIIANSTLQIAVDVRGVSPEQGGIDLEAQLQNLFQNMAALNSRVAAQGGKPNPPAPPMYKGGPAGPGLYPAP